VLAQSLAAAEETAAVPMFPVDKRPGYAAFHNMGATCYLASVLQVLCHARPLFQEYHFVLPSAVAQATVHIVRQMWSSDRDDHLTHAMHEWAGIDN
jgi:hypothetical protein